MVAPLVIRLPASLLSSVAGLSVVAALAMPLLTVFAVLLAPDVPARALIDSATREGARALGFDRDYGTIETGKLARLLTVSVPGRVADVEEYLVSGIDPEQIRWLEHSRPHN